MDVQEETGQAVWASLSLLLALLSCHHFTQALAKVTFCR